LAWAWAIWVASHVSEAPSVLGRWSPSYFMLVVGALIAAALLTATHAGPIYRRLHRHRGRIVALFLSTVFALVACEGVVHLVDPAGISYYKWSKAYSHDRVADDELVWRHRKNFRGTYDGIEYAFNEIGLRDAAIEPKATDELRILVLGDSITMGWGVAEQDTYCRQLESSLARRLGRNVRVINSGVGGYNTVQELAFFRRHREELKPDLVLLLYVRNDVEVNEMRFVDRTDNPSPPHVMIDVFGKSWIYRLVHHFKTYGVSSTGMITLDRDAKGWKDSMAAVGSIADECGDVPLVAFLWRYGPCPVTDAMWQDLSRVAEKQGFLLTDTGPWFLGRDARDLRVSIVDSHPKPEGHRILAEGIERVLAGSAVLPDVVNWQTGR
jgi:hypothetical protein